MRVLPVHSASYNSYSNYFLTIIIFRHIYNQPPSLGDGIMSHSVLYALRYICRYKKYK